jgi:hypothetical protein
LARVSYSVACDADPDTVWAALTEFGQRRGEVWPDISPGSYRVLEQGDGWALVRESTDSIGIWVIERYEWAKPVITATAQDSNVILPGGTWRMEVEHRPGGGSIVHSRMDRRAKGVRGHILHAVFQVTGGRFLAMRLGGMLSGLKPV